ncbi:MAG TPA: ribbon-helix-helix domain-containing protein [Gemmatimonadota bacterium]|nr:ribbon-helix-helix domain-containing protein [Gemmatimonadota bacterium]
MARVREPIQVYLSTKEREKLERVSRRMGVSRSEVLRRGLEEVAERDTEEALADLLRRGILRPPQHKYTPIPDRERRPIMSFEELMADLEDARADREIPG